MKKTNLLVTTAFLLISSLPIMARAAELKVTIDNVSSDKGLIYAQIFHGPENYTQGKARAGLRLKAKKGTFNLTFNNLVPGDYVVRIFHDENNNAALDTNMFGVPSEGYAFSNRAMGNFGPPKYNDMIVHITNKAEQVTTKAHMTY
jgi:uncharacterized protein (DUF2141 family)